MFEFQEKEKRNNRTYDPEFTTERNITDPQESKNNPKQDSLPCYKKTFEIYFNFIYNRNYNFGGCNFYSFVFEGEE